MRTTSTGKIEQKEFSGIRRPRHRSGRRSPPLPKATYSLTFPPFGTTSTGLTPIGVIHDHVIQSAKALVLEMGESERER